MSEKNEIKKDELLNIYKENINYDNKLSNIEDKLQELTHIIQQNNTNINNNVKKTLNKIEKINNKEQYYFIIFSIGMIIGVFFIIAILNSLGFICKG